MKDNTPVSIFILDKEYKVACGEDEQDSLYAAARYLNNKMQEIRSAGKVSGLERIAVMAALNISYELMQSRNKNENEMIGTQEQIDLLLGKINTALSSIER